MGPLFPRKYMGERGGRSFFLYPLFATWAPAGSRLTGWDAVVELPIRHPQFSEPSPPACLVADLVTQGLLVIVGGG